jgi:hypothetical protein
MATLTVEGRRSTSPAAGSRYRRFRPRLVLGYQQDLNSLIEELAAMPAAEAGTILDGAISVLDERQTALQTFGLSGMDLAPTVRYGATLRVLRDLLNQGWTIREDDEGIILDAPGRAAVRLNDPEAAKESIRRSFAFARDAQLSEPSTLEFIRLTEQRGVQRLFTSGAELATRLTEHGPGGIQPVLQMIEPGTRDETTGIWLQDVWRYARHFWSIPYQSTPGRNLFYLVRDAALPERPLIGIAALGNPVLGLSKRDDHFGWSANGVERRLPDLTTKKRRELAGHLFRVLRDAIEATYSGDLVVPSDPLTAPGFTVAALEEIERRSAAERLAKLDAAGEERDADYLLIREAQSAADDGNAEWVDWETVARTALYRRKRAGALADLYRALATLTDLGFTDRGGNLAKALAEPEGRRAIETSLRRIKQEALASNVMELITCGAVPPYRAVLGGKLVALIMLSRQVVADVEQRYGDRVSIIASAMAGRPISRPAKLALVTTSSLYEAYGSSQYNRLKVDTEKGALVYRKVARTESFGTVQFAPDTVHALNEVARHSDSNRREVNNLFGEGTSPKDAADPNGAGGARRQQLPAPQLAPDHLRRPALRQHRGCRAAAEHGTALPAAARSRRHRGARRLLARPLAVEPDHPSRRARIGPRRGVRGVPALARDRQTDRRPRRWQHWRRWQPPCRPRRQWRRGRGSRQVRRAGRPHVHRTALPEHQQLRRPPHGRRAGVDPRRSRRR